MVAAAASGYSQPFHALHNVATSVDVPTSGSCSLRSPGLYVKYSSLSGGGLLRILRHLDSLGTLLSNL